MTTTGTRRTYGQACPVAHGLDLVGERWTLLICRDLMFGPLRFGELRDGLPGLAANLLSERLRFLSDQGIVERVAVPAPAGGHRYQLTGRGRELGPVVHELARFGVASWPDPDRQPPPARLVRGALLALMDPGGLDDHGWAVDITLGGPGVVGLTVAPAATGRRGLRRLRLSGTGASEADGTVITTLGTLRRLRMGETTEAEAVGTGQLLVDLPRSTRARLAVLLGWD